MSAMNAEQLQRLLDRLSEVQNTDELIDLEHGHGPFDEDDALCERALFRIACARCHLARGPAPSPDTFTLERAAPAHARERFEVRGRVGTRIARVGWADGELFGSLYVLRLLAPDDTGLAVAKSARERINAVFDVVLDELPALAVA
jgi:hypothetical protein